MPNSILTEIKQMIGVTETDTAFDLDIRIWINDAFSKLNDVGVGPEDGYRIESATEEWDEFIDEGPILDKVKAFVFMSTKYAFDPPNTGFHTTAAKEIIDEELVRISYAREDTEWEKHAPPPPPAVPDIWADEATLI